VGPFETLSQRALPSPICVCARGALARAAETLSFLSVVSPISWSLEAIAGRCVCVVRVCV